MHCPFCARSEFYLDPVILRAHYRVKHVDKGIDVYGTYCYFLSNFMKDSFYVHLLLHCTGYIECVHTHTHTSWVIVLRSVICTSAVE